MIEDTLENIESTYSSIFQNKIRKKQPLEREERGRVSIFVAAMLFRTKAFRSKIESYFQEIDEFIKKLESMSEEEKENLASISQLVEPERTITSEEFRKITKDIPTFHSSSIIAMLPEVSNIIFNMKWNFLTTEETDNFFLTSDNPCVLINVPAIKKYGFGTFGSSPGLCQEDVNLSLPLSSHILLFVNWKLQKEKYMIIASKMIDQLNIRTMMFAKKIAVACNDKKLKEVLNKLAELKK